MITEEDIAKLRKNFEKFQNIQNCQEKNVEKIIQIAQQYSEIFQDDELFQGFTPYLAEYQFLKSPANARVLPEFLLSYALNTLSDKKDRYILALFIRSFVNIVPDGRNKAKSIISSFIRSFATKDFVFASCNKSFLPYIVSTQILNRESTDIQLSEKNTTFAAIIAIQKDPLLLPDFQELIEKHFLKLPIDEIIKVALVSNETMKFVLSTTVPFILDGNPKAFQIIQKLASSSKPIPAQLVANELKIKKGINCLL